MYSEIYLSANVSFFEKNFKISGHNADPSFVDYDILGLHKKRTLIKGELRIIEYFRNFDGNVYSDLIVKEERTFIRNEILMALYRIQKSTWYFEDGEEGLVKEYIKYYTPETSLQEGITRRTNIIDQCKIYMLHSVGRENGYDFLQSLKSQRDLYVEGFRQPLLDGVLTSVKSYLTEQIRTDLLEILTFDV
jgi:hypothetical protein